MLGLAQVARVSGRLCRSPPCALLRHGPQLYPGTDDPSLSFFPAVYLVAPAIYLVASVSLPSTLVGMSLSAGWKQLVPGILNPSALGCANCVALQVCVVAFTKSKMTVKASAFDRNLGGRDFDMVGGPRGLTLHHCIASCHPPLYRLLPSTTASPLAIHHCIAPSLFELSLGFRTSERLRLCPCAGDVQSFRRRMEDKDRY